MTKEEAIEAFNKAADAWEQFGFPIIEPAYSSKGSITVQTYREGVLTEVTVPEELRYFADNMGKRVAYWPSEDKKEG